MGTKYLDSAKESKQDIIDGVVDALAVDLGDFSAQSDLKSLLAVLGGGWNTNNKTLYAGLITDYLAHATHGLVALKGYVDCLPATLHNITATNVRQSVCLTGDASDTIGKILFDSNAWWTDGGRLDLILDNIELQTEERVAGKIQPATTTESLNQALGTYDLFTGTTQKVLLKSLVISMPTGAAGGAITSISIQTDAATPQVIISATQGAVANLTSEAQLAWTGAVVIPIGTKIQLTIAGGAHGSAYTATIDVEYEAMVSGGYLA